VQAGRTWGAAAPYADVDASAANALVASEDRLRALHPYAMGIYDRLRQNGQSPTQAMTDAAPFFARHPFAREGQPSAPRAAITQAAAGGAGSWFSQVGHDDDVTTQARRTRVGDPTTVFAPATPGADSESVLIVGADQPRSAADQAAVWAAALAAQSFPVTARQAVHASAAADPETRHAALLTTPHQRVIRPGSSR